MPSVSEFVGWFFANVSVPLLAPVALLPMLKLARAYRGVSGGLVLRAIQDGQLFWTVIAMCATACYELARAMARGLDDGASALAWSAMVFHVLFIIGSAVLVMLGTIDTLHDGHTSSDGLPKDRRLMQVSLGATLTTAVTFSTVHFIVG